MNIHKKRIAAVQEANVFPNEIAGVVCEYLLLKDNADKLEALLQSQQDGVLIVRTFNTWLAISWSREPSEFKQKMYYICAGDEGSSKSVGRSLRGISFNGLLPSPKDAPNTEMSDSVHCESIVCELHQYYGFRRNRVGFWETINTKLEKILARIE